MPLPVVAIVGRPNVGKSSLLNMIAKSMISIVDPTAGVTRDRVSTVCEVDDLYFELVDTGGYGIEDKDNLTQQIEEQIFQAMQRAALILFVVDVQGGVTGLDATIAEMLRKLDAPVITVANKCDTPSAATQAAEFHRLGFGDPLCVSALHGAGRSDILDTIVRHIGHLAEEPPTEPVMKIAVVGKRNVGKSTFINSLAGEERVIVSEVPGTTRDAVDVTFQIDGRTFVAIDTAGVRKESKLDDIEFYGYTRAKRAVRRADVVLLLIDATADVGQVDKHLARLVAEEFKPCVLVINKWDLAKGRSDTDRYGEYLTKVLPELDVAPISFTTARDGRNVQSTIDVAAGLFRQARTRVGTGPLNQALKIVLAVRGPSAKRGARTPKIYYATQISICPPTLVCFVNDPSLIKEDYQRFLTNRLQELLPFGEIPIRLLFRSHRGSRRGSAGIERAEAANDEQD